MREGVEEQQTKNLADCQKKLKKWLIVGADFLVLLVTGATLLGAFLSRNSNRMLTAESKLRHDGKVLEEKVEVDVNLKTETFYTKSEDGETAIMYDTKNDLAAYKFSGLHICFILEDDTYSEDEVDKVANELQKNGEGKVEEAESGGQVNITLDESRGKVDKSILTEKMLDFCKAHEIYWAIARQGGQPAAENVFRFEFVTTSPFFGLNRYLMVPCAKDPRSDSVPCAKASKSLRNIAVLRTER
ncbi:CNMD [Branchiostoma lanceolatum]|uniref:CNMD protein n=1 Tax=Branchiostoma lanceolatum TaxID=7740 RepID=A0A8K0EEM4_BRALA|nr:CNMD [Branchiostoma lanceolatum]